LAEDIMNYPLPSEVLLICVSYKPDKRSRFYKRFDGNVTVKSFPLLNERELPAFVSQE
jgi:DNA polymerase III delta subunit